MKKFAIIFFSIILSCSSALATTYFNAPVSFDDRNTGKNSVPITKIGDTYYHGTTSYTKQGNVIYGSNGKQYYDYGGFIQSSSGKTYQKNNNLIQELH